MWYFEVGSTFEGNENIREGCSPRDEFDGEELEICDNFYDITTIEVGKHYEEANDWLQYKVWDLGGFYNMKTHDKEVIKFST